MKKRLSVLLVFCLFSFRVFADEGMWLPLLLGEQVYAKMVKKGLRLTKDQLYSINKSSLKDAIIIFGGGCTGEIVSAQGLIFTNHHCGYDAITRASSMEHNYLRDGFYATDFKSEIPTDLSVQFLLSIQDVTAEILSQLKGLSGTERLKKQGELISGINQRLSNEDQSIEARVSPMFKGNQFFVFVYQRYRDIRLVGTPPESVGKFGGDTDNWEWPRHTGDFSVFRIYASANGKPAAYSPDNKPLTPKYFLPISLKPLKNGDFAMTWGYPGTTNRYESSFGVKISTDISSPTLVRLRDMRLKYMFEEMRRDPSVKLQLAASYARIANYWKFFDGENKQLLKYDVLGKKKAFEKDFQAWANDKPEYKNLLSDWEAAYKEWQPYAKHRVFLNEGIMGSPLLNIAYEVGQVDGMLSNNADKETVQKKMEELTGHVQTFLKNENVASDKRILGKAFQMYREEVPLEQQPEVFYQDLQTQYGPLDEAAFKKAAEDIFANTMLLNSAKWDSFVGNPTAEALASDPAVKTAKAFITNYLSKVSEKFKKFGEQNEEYGRIYLKGIMEKDPVAAKQMYPDATFTMRVSYGEVKSYKPRDAVSYDYVTTSAGIFEKYKPGDYEFDLPAKQIELLKKKDFGHYEDPTRKSLVIAFITTNDITGGNSGSPIINKNGELIGLAFDGNYEALSHKIAFDKELNRTICVDIRYVLWCIDKLGGATRLINELKIIK